MSLLTKQKETHRLQEGAYCCQQEGWEEGIVREFTLLYLKWMTNKDLHTVHAYIQTYIPHMELCSVLCGRLDGKGFIGEGVHAYVKLSPFAVHLKLSQLVC